MLCLAIILVTLPHAWQTSVTPASADCFAETGTAHDACRDESRLQEHVDLLVEEIGGLSLVQKRAVSHSAVKIPAQPKNAEHPKEPAAVVQEAPNLDAKLLQDVAHYASRDLVSQMSLAALRQLAVQHLSQSGLSGSTLILLVALGVLLYCGLICFFMPGSGDFFARLLGRREGNLKEEREGFNPAASSMLSEAQTPMPREGYVRSQSPLSMQPSFGRQEVRQPSPPNSNRYFSPGAQLAGPPSAAPMYSSPRSSPHPRPPPQSGATLGPMSSPALLCPDVTIPPTGKLFLPIEIGDSRQRGPFDIRYSETSEFTAFSLKVREIPGDHADVLELMDPSESSSLMDAVMGGGPRPCASAGPARSKTSHYIVDNKLVGTSGAGGVAYRGSKELGDKVKPSLSGVAPWGSVVAGVEEGDGWLKVGTRRFLPMSMDGTPVIFPAGQAGGPGGTVIYNSADQPSASILPLAVGYYQVEQTGQPVMHLRTNNPEFRVEVVVGAKRVAGIPHQRKRIEPRDYLELILFDEGMDPVLVLMSCLAVIRKLVM